MTANDIRNIALLGHGGSGKTSLVEQMLFMTKGIDRLGKTADGNTTCDYDAEEIKRQISISLAFAPVMYKGKKINVMDAPGNFDFSGEAVCAIRAAECAVIVGNAKDGLSVGMERTWKMLGKKPRMMFINRVEEANADYASCIEAVKAKYGTAIAPIVATKADGNKAVTVIVDLLHNKAYDAKGECAIPADMADEVEALRAELMEAAAGADEELMEKFFETMELSAEEIAKGLKLGVRDGSVAPVLCGSAISGLGVDMLMQTVLALVPVAPDMPAEAAEDDDGNAIEVAHDPNGSAAAFVFKTISDQYGKFSMIKVIRGKDRGKEGTVKQVLSNDRLIVEGVQIVKKHVRATQQGQQAGIVSTEAPIHRSNVMVIDPETKQPTRVGITVKEEARDGKVKTVRVRVAKKSGKELA